MKRIIFRHLAIVLCLMVFGSLDAKSQVVDTVAVHFLYGSKPKFKHRKTERKWFGGLLGGHVGIETDSHQVVHFLPKGGLHMVGHPTSRQSVFVHSSPKAFWEILGGKVDQVKKLTIYIPITETQQQVLDSLHHQYLHNTPYDYAFLGMRCGAATYDILSQIGLLPKHSRAAMVWHMFYPRRLRNKLIKQARQNAWKTQCSPGIDTRRWERDLVKAACP